MIAHLSYVLCDRCHGFPAQPADGHEEARAIARREGYRHDKVEGDICRDCRIRAGEIPPPPGWQRL